MIFLRGFKLFFETYRTLAVLLTSKTWVAEIKICLAFSQVCHVKNFLLHGSCCCYGTNASKVQGMTPALQWTSEKPSKPCASLEEFGGVAQNNR